MSVSKEFMDIVAQGDKNAVRTSLANYMILDRSYKLFDESFSYAQSKMDIIERHDGQELTQDRKKWTEEYLNEQLVAVVINFSKERIAHIKQVIPVALKTSGQAADNKPSPNISTPSRTGRKRTEQEIHTAQKTQSVCTTHTSETRKQPRTGRKRTEQEIHTAQKTQSVCTTHTSETRKQPKRSTISSGRTGRTTISERETSICDEDSHSSSSGFDYGTALIVGGAAVAVVGLAVSEAVVIGAGIVIAGSGCVVKVSKKK